MPVNTPKQGITVSFYANGTKVTDRIITLSETIKMPKYEAESGYTVEDWYFDKDIWTQKVSKETIKELIDSGETRVSAYAKITPINYQISYENVDGADVESFVTEYNIESETIVLSDVSVEHYAFDGWFIGSERVTEIASGSTGDKVLTAKFTPINYDITFVNTKGSQNTNPVTFNIESGDITLSAIHSDGYNFEGWFVNDEQVVSIPSGSSGNKELTAKWSLIGYTLSYENVKGADIESFVTDYNVESETIVLSDVSAEHYTFDGWFIGSERVTEIAAGSTGNKVLTAKFTPINYNLTFADTKNSANPNPDTFNVDSGDITLSAIHSDGYNFEGWFVDDEQVTSIPSGSFGDKEFTAKWSLIDYTVSYENTFQVDTSSYPDTYNIESETITLPLLNDDGILCHTFKGWLINGTSISEIATGTTGNIVLTADYDVSHTVVTEPYIAPTCETKGRTEGRYCSVCNEVLLQAREISARGHDYKATWGWNELTSASLVLICQNDNDHVVTVDATVNSVTVDPSCTKDGADIYTATAVYNGNTYTDVKTQVIPSIPHNFVAIDGNVKQHTCTMCSNLFDHEDADYTGTCDICEAFIENIIQIATNYDMNDIANDLTATYVLTADITLSGTWSPLGSSSKPFTGKLFGNGHKIINLSLSGGSDGGLFVVNSGVIEGVTLENLSINTEGTSGTVHCGGFAAHNSGIIRNCTVTGTTSIRINNWANNATVSCTYIAGAVCAKNTNGGKVENCQVDGTVNALMRVYALESKGGIGPSGTSQITSAQSYGNLSGLNEGVISDSTSSATLNVSFEVRGESGVNAEKGIATLNAYVGSAIGINKGTLSNCKVKAYKEVSRVTETKVHNKYSNINNNQANLSVKNANQYEGMIGSNEGGFKIEKFSKID